MARSPDLGAWLEGQAGVRDLALLRQGQAGGLLAVHQSQTGGGLDAGDYLYFHDTSGNVGQLVAWTTNFGGAQGNAWHADRLLAHYEYNPYVRVRPSTGRGGRERRPGDQQSWRG